MDYILNKINSKMARTKPLPGCQHDYVSFCRQKVEYILMFILGYLWDQNWNELSHEMRREVMNDVETPSIGTVLKICRDIDIKEEFITSKSNQTLIQYVSGRNDHFGHGFTHTDMIEKIAKEFEHIVELIDKTGFVVGTDYHIYRVIDIKGNLVYGERYGFDGQIHPWQCSTQTREFEKDNIYVTVDEDPWKYIRLSPFVVIKGDEEIYLYRSLRDRMAGETAYFRILSTGKTKFKWNNNFFGAPAESDENRERSSVNGTVRNKYESVCERYIEIGKFGAKAEIRRFLIDIDNRGYGVCGKIWGPGGVGKTAIVQSICEDFWNSKKASFDYIVFVSAKDRHLSPETGKVERTEAPITNSYEGVLYSICSTMNIDKPTDPVDVENPVDIISFEGRLLVIVDDYETFPEEQKIKIEKFIGKLNPEHHRVLITTRAHVKIGHEFNVHELDKRTTIDFLRQIMEQRHSGMNDSDLDKDEVQEEIYKETSGRPLFILIFAVLWAMRGNLKEALRSGNIISGDEAVKFLFDRVTDSLSPTGRKIFGAISRLMLRDQLICRLTILQYVVDMESRSEEFNRGIEELVSFMTVRSDPSKDSIEVLSKDILRYMQNTYDSLHIELKESIQNHLDSMTADVSFGVDRSLLEKANEARNSEGVLGKKKVKGLYLKIIERDSCSMEIKSEAIRNLADYLYNNCNEKEEAVELYQKFENIFLQDHLVVRMFAEYCWSIHRRSQAIGTLHTFVRSKAPDPIHNVWGRYIQYKAHRWMEEISDLGMHEEQKKQAITRDVKSLLNEARTKNTMSDGFGTESDMEANIAKEGFLHLANACIMLGMKSEARDVCNFGLRESRNDPNLNEGFNKASSRIGSMQVGHEIDLGWLHWEPERKETEWSRDLTADAASDSTNASKSVDVEEKSGVSFDNEGSEVLESEYPSTVESRDESNTSNSSFREQDIQTFLNERSNQREDPTTSVFVELQKGGWIGRGRHDVLLWLEKKMQEERKWYPTVDETSGKRKRKWHQRTVQVLEWKGCVGE